MSEKISDPYTKFFANFTTNYEYTDMIQPGPDLPIPGINDSYSLGDVFKQPTFEKQVWNIQIDDRGIKEVMGSKYMHVNYARDPSHPLHGLFVALSAAAAYAAYDGGATFRGIVMKAKGFTSDLDMNQYLQHNEGKISIGLEDKLRWQTN
jgi:hypothetical protein